MKKKFKVGDVVMILDNKNLLHHHEIENLGVVVIVEIEPNYVCIDSTSAVTGCTTAQWHCSENLVKVGVL